MFTGLITDRGTLRRLSPSGENWTIEVQTAYPTDDLQLGESIAVDGACLTVTSIGKDSFTLDASPETLRKTTLGDRKVGDRLHLERALRVGDRLGGHVVLGHVDGVGEIRARTQEKNSWILEIEAPPEVSQFLIDKGSVTVDGVSLTVNSVSGNRFLLAIIPFTADETNFADYRVGRRVNLEGDVLGKYVKKLLTPNAEKAGTIDVEFLAEHGFSDD